MPDESKVHKRTWMAFVANEYIWSKKQIPEVKKNLALIASIISKYEPVAMLVSPQDYSEAKALIEVGQSSFPIDLIEFRVDDLWLRDTGPTFVYNKLDKKVAIDFNFNGWGNKQEHTQDSQVARFIASKAGAKLQKTHLVLEGGSIEVDGKGTAIMTKSSVINDNRNPGVSQTEIELELERLLGIKKIIWLDGIKGKDITDGHVDFYARFTHSSQVVVSRENYQKSFDYNITRQNIEILNNSKDAQGKKLTVSIIDNPENFNLKFGKEYFASGYIGYYVCNGAVILQKFGDPNYDDLARKTLQKAFPERVIEQVQIDGIASGGGSIHCTTQQEI